MKSRVVILLQDFVRRLRVGTLSLTTMKSTLGKK